MSVKELTGEQKERLKHALASGSQLGAADIGMINMEPYKERLGKEWFKYRNIINAYTVSAIKENVSDQDIFVHTKNGYAVFFFSKSGDEIRTCANRIADQVAQALRRERVFEDPPISCKASPITPEELLRHLDSENLPSASPPAPSTAAAVSNVLPIRTPEQSTSYFPLWHAKLERVVGSICIAETQSSVVPVADGKYYEAAGQHFSRDVLGFNTMLTDAYKLLKSGEKAAVLFSINFKSFCAAEFHRDYMVALRQVPANLVPFLTPRFVRIPAGAPQTLIAQKTQILTSVFKHIALQTRPDTDLKRFEFVACSILVTSWRDVVKVAGPGQGAVRTLNAFCQSVKNIKLNSLIDGVDTPEAYAASVGAGADFICGNVIGPKSRTPISQFKLTNAEIREELARPRAAPDTSRTAYV